VSRRARAILFLGLAALAATGAAAIANGYGSSVAQGLGPLRPAVIVESGLRAGTRIDQAQARRALEVRRVPERFIPPGTLASPAEAVGLVTAAALPPGSYLAGAQLRPPGRRPSAIGPLGSDRSPVEIVVSGADALLVGAPRPEGSRVDVIVTSEPGSGPGRAFVAAHAVPLLALRPGPEGPGPGGTAAATLGLTRHQALRLIAAESFARRLTLMPIP
jgi:Flp pilus assembly protein CpaB